MQGRKLLVPAPMSTGAEAIASAERTGISITVLADDLLHKLVIASDGLAAPKAGYLHVTVLKHIDFDSLSHDMHGYADRVASIAGESEVDLRLLKLAKKRVQRMWHS